jgi:capsular polysaccharide transport system permease protein
VNIEIEQKAARFVTPGSPSNLWDACLAKLRLHYAFTLIVLLPTLLTAAYFFLIAADQYESEADFVVKSAAQISDGYSGGMAQIMGLASLTNSSQSESYTVDDFLTSHDAVAQLQKRLDLVSIFRRPEADLIARLWVSNPTAEYLLKYYGRQVTISFDPDTGLSTLRVHAFRPGDAQRIAQTLLDVGEDHVNAVNARALENGLKVAQTQLAAAEAGMLAVQNELTAQRVGKGDIDPSRTSVAQITLLTGLQQSLAQARTLLAAMEGAVRSDSPQYVALMSRIHALENQIAAQEKSMTGQGDAMAPNLGAYESLKLRQDFAAKRYEAAAAALESARQQLLKQQIFLVRNVEPNLPEKSLYPMRWLVTFSVLASLLLVYGIGWLILAGVKEHAQ